MKSRTIGICAIALVVTLIAANSRKDTSGMTESQPRISPPPYASDLTVKPTDTRSDVLFDEIAGQDGPDPTASLYESETRGLSSYQPVVGAVEDEETTGRPQREFDEDSALYDARREMARRGYRGLCTSDCEGHEAGYQWAYENRLSRPSYTFDSQSFDEGQEAFVKDVRRRVEEKREEFEADPEYSEY
ncbi:hypothetical protein DMC47_05230 [Nostoc sp. 3335mG]|nr:hypothetical protein DMC47_05230 [Nostoc sp. 3335mG]